MEGWREGRVLNCIGAVSQVLYSQDRIENRSRRGNCFGTLIRDLRARADNAAPEWRHVLGGNMALLAGGEGGEGGTEGGREGGREG